MFSIQRIRSAHHESSIVLFSETARHGLRVTACCCRASARGIMPGCSLAEARLLLEGDTVETLIARHDPDADHELLCSLAENCQQFSPAVMLEGTDAILLDLSGCTHLFGTELQMARDVRTYFSDLRFCTDIAIADQSAVAWTMARFSKSPNRICIVEPGGSDEAVSLSPLAALKLPRETVGQLHRLDIRTIGQLRQLPRASLPSRFGSVVLERLDQMSGRLPDIFEPMTFSEPVVAIWHLEHPTGRTDTLHAIASHLLQQIVARVEQQQEGILQLHCHLRSERHSSICASVRTVSPSHNLQHLQLLLNAQLDKLRLPSDVLAIELEVVASCRITTHQQTLFESTESNELQRSTAELLDRLTSRMGPDAVVTAELLSDTQPEYRYRYVPVRSEEHTTSAESVHGEICHEPLFLLPTPERLTVTLTEAGSPPTRIRWQQQDYRVHCWHGPQRIESGWWRHRHVSRDYYRVEFDDGQQCWMFRDRLCQEQQGWYLHGWYA